MTPPGTHIVRPARADDIDALYELAKLTGGGFTNLPADRHALVGKLDRSLVSFRHEHEEPGDDLFLLVLEEVATGHVRGTAQVFARVGARVPFYSYRIGALSQTSRELGRTFRAEMLTLSTDLEGASEVGGLFLHPAERAGGLGLLLARSRYLLIRRNRERFADRTIAELRGVINDAGTSPFWDGLGAKFFGMTFREADDFNAIHGHQFIADLMPKHPIYTAMLPESARAVIGHPHASGRAAMRMLENEGFVFDRYVDIFDGGPTVTAETDRIRSIRKARAVKVSGTDLDPAGRRSLIARGGCDDFSVAFAIAVERYGGIAVDRDTATGMKLKEGDDVLWLEER
ncbi:arginine N-succinyltransferase [Sphingomonas sp. ID0503]|uniref:arginine N-succinyltransferase n=1 Tax=Sphingomonas sp. ID0503 TaxID=3399691 RepID=UPI003AFA3E77